MPKFPIWATKPPIWPPCAPLHPISSPGPPPWVFGSPVRHRRLSHSLGRCRGSSASESKSASRYKFAKTSPMIPRPRPPASPPPSSPQKKVRTSSSSRYGTVGFVIHWVSHHAERRRRGRVFPRSTTARRRRRRSPSLPGTPAASPSPPACHTKHCRKGLPSFRTPAPPTSPIPPPLHHAVFTSSSAPSAVAKSADPVAPAVAGCRR